MTPLRRRILDYGLAAVLLAVPVVMLQAGLKSPDRMSGLDQAVLRISSPLQSAMSWLVEGVGGVWGGYVALVDVEEENRELRSENQRLRHELGAARRAAADARALEELVQLRRETDAETLGARVVASSINPYFRVVRLRLDRGAGDVEVGMPVIDDVGLVGRVHRVFGRYSDVLLVTDPDSSIDVVVPRTGGRGWVTGLARDDIYRCKVEFLERGKPVEVGDKVVTFGLGALPAGIPVGVVSAVRAVDYQMYQEVEIEPAVDFGSLRRVLVVLSPPPPPDPDGAEPAPAEPAHRMGSY
ncbi:MAG TPA: rod shape-determining protein MreC [Kofleriaceae bacterium]|nr:rod shape-determining protein MreC [Kofleriaceae bacterium]